MDFKKTKYDNIFFRSKFYKIIVIYSKYACSRPNYNIGIMLIEQKLFFFYVSLKPITSKLIYNYPYDIIPVRILNTIWRRTLFII